MQRKMPNQFLDPKVENLETLRFNLKSKRVRLKTKNLKNLMN
jgi:hypothetical protein